MTTHLPASRHGRFRVSRRALRMSACALAAGALCLAAQANQSLMTSGASLTLGPVFNRANLGSVAFNPANGLRLVADDEHVRFGVLDVGARYEVGSLDDLKATMDRVRQDIDSFQSIQTQTQADATQAKLNGDLKQMETGARFSVQGRGSLLSPLIVRSGWLRGALSLGVNAYAQGAARFRYSAVNVDSPSLVSPRFKVSSASAVDMKGATVVQASLGYSTELSSYFPAAWRGKDSTYQLDMGVRMNAYRAKLYRQVSAIVDANGNSAGLDLAGARNSARQASARSLDLGLMWSDTHYQLGATAYNIGNPRMYFPNPAADLSSANVAAARQLALENSISLTDAVSLKPHLVLEGSVFTANHRWLLQGSVAANQTNDFVGDPQRYVTAAASYNAERFDGALGSVLNYVVPSVRLGYRRNLVGTQTSMYALGVGWGVFNLDLTMSPSFVSYDGSRAPRSAGFSLSVSEKF